jgi:hypothetical protein
VLFLHSFLKPLSHDRLNSICEESHLLVIPVPIFPVGLLLVGLLSCCCCSLTILVVLATFLGIVGRVGPTIILAMLAEFCGASFLRDSLD